MPLLPEPGEAGPTPSGYHSDDEMWRCQQEYLYARVRKVRLPQVQLPKHFTIGIGFHAGRARWFRLGFKHDEATWRSIREAVDADLRAQPLPSAPDAERKALELLKEYTEHWAGQPLPRVRGAEMLIGPAPIWPGSKNVRTARLDDVSAYPSIGYAEAIGESKTTSGSINDVVKYYEQHGQLLTQMLLLKTVAQAPAKYVGIHAALASINGVMLDVTKKPSGDRKADFARVFIPIEQRQLTWFQRNLEDMLRRKAAMTWNSQVRRNPSACTRVVAGGAVVECPFKDLCRYGRSAATKYMVGDTWMSAWKPSPGKEVAPWE